MRYSAAASSDESTILILWTPTQFVLQRNQWFHDGLNLFFFIICCFWNKHSDEHYSPSRVCFCLLSVWNGPLMQVLIKKQMQFVYLRTCFSLYSVVSISSAWFYFLLKSTTPIHMKIFIYSTDHFLLKSSFLPAHRLLINHIFSWKSKLTCIKGPLQMESTQKQTWEREKCSSERFFQKQ